MIKMIKTVHRNMTGVSNMADQGRIILQLYSVCNLSIVSLFSAIECLYLAYRLAPFLTIPAVFFGCLCGPRGGKLRRKSEEIFGKKSANSNLS